jgi:hypothetical protein
MVRKSSTMTVTNVHITQEAQKLLIRAATSRNVSVEELASEILSQGIQSQLSEIAMNHQSHHKSNVNPLTGLQPYAFYATPEESGLPSDEWNMEECEEGQ